MCSTCGVTLEWHDKLYVANPPAQWRYCAKDGCVEAEAAYHGFSVDEMTGHRNALNAWRQAEEARARVPITRAQLKERIISLGGTWEGGNGRPERISFGSSVFKLAPGEACWCNLGKDCSGSHEIDIGEPVNVCGECGEIMTRPLGADPHWATGRGPICPKPKRST